MHTVVDSQLVHEYKKVKLFNQMHSEWQHELADHKTQFDKIESALAGQNIAPNHENIMLALKLPISGIRVVIFGQDPYPRPGYAQGLAFSVGAQISKLPATLKNIFKELTADYPDSSPENGDLQRWSDQGVLLINRILTTQVGQSLAHVNIGWQAITDDIAKVLGAQAIVAILWGKNAQELAGYFRDELTITSAHPSPLSAYRGFFGSRPFSRANEILTSQGSAVIHW